MQIARTRTNLLQTRRTALRALLALGNVAEQTAPELVVGPGLRAQLHIELGGEGVLLS